MLPLFQEQFANAGSLTHVAGRQVRDLVDASLHQLATNIGATDEELVITSGATESNNLALFGCCLHPRQKRRKLVSVVSEHRALLDPVHRLQHQGFEVVLVPVENQDGDCPGRVDLEALSAAIDDQTALVSVMLANNEIGVLQPLSEIARMCHEHGALLHSDASQALGRIPVLVDELGVDLMSFSAHKFYGPKGVGGLFVRRRERRVKLQAQIVGGGQQHNFRSGTLNSPGIVGMAASLVACTQRLAIDAQRIQSLRNQLFDTLASSLDWMVLNGPPLGDQRLPGNLNCCFLPIEGQSLMLEMPDLAVSSGSACTSAEPEPSHVLTSIGLTEDQARCSLRVGLGRDNSADEVQQAAEWIIAAAQRLRKLV